MVTGLVPLLGLRGRGQVLGRMDGQKKKKSVQRPSHGSLNQQLKLHGDPLKIHFQNITSNVTHKILCINNLLGKIFNEDEIAQENVCLQNEYPLPRVPIKVESLYVLCFWGNPAKNYCRFANEALAWH